MRRAVLALALSCGVAHAGDRAPWTAILPGAAGTADHVWLGAGVGVQHRDSDAFRHLDPPLADRPFPVSTAFRLYGVGVGRGTSWTELAWGPGGNRLLSRGAMTTKAPNLVDLLGVGGLNVAAPEGAAGFAPGLAVHAGAGAGLWSSRDKVGRLEVRENVFLHLGVAATAFVRTDHVTVVLMGVITPPWAGLTHLALRAGGEYDPAFRGTAPPGHDETTVNGALFDTGNVGRIRYDAVGGLMLVRGPVAVSYRVRAASYRVRDVAGIAELDGLVLTAHLLTVGVAFDLGDE